MTQKKDIYKCEVCGNIVEVLHAGGGELVCCGKPMVLQKANYVDAAQEKHVPVIEKSDKGIIVKVGEVPHPMEAEHYIEWIEATLASGEVFRKYLMPGDKPEMNVCVCNSEKCSCDVDSAREYCNLHGLWANTKK